MGFRLDTAVPVRELIEFDVSILEIAISEIVISLLRFTATAERFISP
jgi:hypothetical protein